MKAAPRSLVNRYARSLFKVAVDQKVVEQVRNDLAEIADVLHGNKELTAMLLNPGVNTARLKALVDALCKRLPAQELTRHFLHLLIDKDRIEVLHTLSPVFDDYYRKHQGEVVVTVTTAVTVSDALQSQIKSQLAAHSGMTPLVTWNTNPELLGGLVVEWPDRVFDGSLARKISNLKSALAGTA
ncbi:ATP synthase F1 subunit delta [candidate division KSB1 bacterium]|nr:ATP synthase F1 subunit delta [candidate division KSB1 bacterium]